MVHVNVVINLQRCTSLWDPYQREALFVSEVSINWATGTNWQTKLLHAWKVAQLKLLRQGSVHGQLKEATPVHVELRSDGESKTDIIYTSQNWFKDCKAFVIFYENETSRFSWFVLICLSVSSFACLFVSVCLSVYGWLIGWLLVCWLVGACVRAWELSLSLSLSLPHTHTHTRVCARARLCSLARLLSCSFPRSLC